MIQYVCDGCKKPVFKDEAAYNAGYLKNEGYYCPTCKPKAVLITGTLRGQLKVRNDEDLLWYETEKAAQIEAQCELKMMMEGESIKSEIPELKGEDDEGNKTESDRTRKMDI